MSDKNLIQTKKLWITLADDVVVAEKFHKFSEKKTFTTYYFFISCNCVRVNNQQFVLNVHENLTKTMMNFLFSKFHLKKHKIIQF